MYHYAAISKWYTCPDASIPPLRHSISSHGMIEQDEITLVQ